MPNFRELATLIVNTRGTKQDIDNRKTALQATDTLLDCSLVLFALIY